MSKTLLDYAVKFTQVSPTSAASTAFLHQLGVVCKPTATPAAMVVDGSDGTLLAPVTITLNGLLLAGMQLNCRVSTDAQPNSYAPWVVPSQMSADDAAVEYAALLSGIPDVSASADGNVITVVPVGTSPTVNVDDPVVGIAGDSNIPFIDASAVGDVINPAEITLFGDYKAGDEISFTVTSDLPETQNITVVLTAADDVTNAVDIAAAVNSAFVSGVIATGESRHVRIRAEDLITTEVTISDLTFTPAPPAPEEVPEFVPQIVIVTDPSQLAFYTDAADDIIAAFDGGLNRVYLILCDDESQIPLLVRGKECDFYTVYGSLDYSQAIYEVAFATWQGVKAITPRLLADAQRWVVNDKSCGFIDPAVEARDYFGIFAFANLLSASTWRNQQYIPVSPTLGTAVEELGTAELYFDERISFYLSDEEQGTRLAFFVAGGLSITTPYINEELKVTTQSDFINFLSANQPFNIETNRRLLEQRGNKIIDRYVDDGLLDPDGENFMTITEGDEVFICKGELTTSEAVALWRVDIDAIQNVGV